MNRTKVAVLVSGGGTNLQAILDACGRGECPHAEIALVLANAKKAYALERAANAGVATAVVTKRQAGSQEAFEAAIHETLVSNGMGCRDSPDTCSMKACFVWTACLTICA